MAKVFINHVDEYFGKNAGKFISEAFIGDTTRDPEDEDEASAAGGDQRVKYSVVGTLKSSESVQPSWLSELVQLSSETPDDQFLANLLECDIIVYEISQELEQADECSRAISILHSALDQIKTQKIFICVSSVLSWARSTPLIPEEPDEPFTEDDYRRRKPNTNYKTQTQIEKLVIKFGKTDKSKLMTYVVASGLQYGRGENVFHSFFKSAWHNEKELAIYGAGQNFIPTIHIQDMSSVLVNIADAKPKTRYMIAVDEGATSQEEIVRAISTNIGTGKVRFAQREDAFTVRDIRQIDFDQFTVNLRMTASFVSESMTIDWQSQTGVVENIKMMVNEYRTVRNLKPLRVCILGPPGVGKSTIIQQLCKHYKIHHLKMTSVIEENIQRLERSSARCDQDDLSEEDDSQAQRDKDFLAELRENKEGNDSGYYDDQYINAFFKETLMSSRCQNQGFILDGYPKKYDHAKELFAPDEDSEEDTVAKYNTLIMPDVVISLEAKDDFLKERVMTFPESLVATDPRYSEEGFLTRLAQFRRLNVEDETVLNFFDELEVHPEHINVEDDNTPSTPKTIAAMKKLIGEPRNYGPTKEELEEIRRREAQEKLQRETAERIERERQERLERENREQREAAWQARLAEVHRQEQEVLEVRTAPLRNYLMQHVMPTLNQGLIEAIKARPDDPIDFLAEYLFQHNPIVG